MKKRFKYNLTLYYQATIVYFIAFVLYVIIRGEFVENSFHLLLKDPILYAFGLIVTISIIALLYNMFRKRFIEFEDDTILFGNKYSIRKINIYDIDEIKLFKKRLEKEYSFFRLVKIKLKKQNRKILIRTSDYENEEELIEQFKLLQTKLEKKNV
jgi:hypothetical protein